MCFNINLRVTVRSLINIILIAIFGFSTIFAGETGKLNGFIKEKEANEALIGANVVVLGTTHGAASDATGFYFINNILPGTYRVKVSMIGYQTIIFEDVKINADLTTELNANLINATIEMKSEVVVVADRPVVQKDLTSTRIVVEGPMIVEDLRAQNVNEILRLQAGVTVGTDGQFHVRGGRSGGTVYQVDGVPLTNPFLRSQAGDIEVENVQQLQVHLGTFDAEYGNAADGIITINTKDGGGKYSGKILYESPMLNSSPYHEKDWNLNRDDLESLSEADRKIYKDEVRKSDGSSAYDYVSVLDDPYTQDYLGIKMLGTISGNLSGPVPFIPNLKFFASGRFRNENSPLPFGYTLYRSLTLKLTYPIASTFTLRGSYDWSQNFNQDYDHAYKYWRWFNSGLDTLGRSGSFPIDRVLSNRQTINVKHVLSQNTFYDFTLGRIRDFESEIVPDRNVIYDPATGNLISSDYFTRLYVGGVEGSFRYGDVRYWRKTESIQYLVKANLESQVTNHHQVRSGFEFKNHEIFRHRIGMLPRSSIEFFKFTPIEAAVYLQDKVEYSFMILKVGVRLDYFNPRADAYPDPSNVLEVITSSTGSAEYKAVDKIPVSPHVQISPRIGIAHPISDKTSIYFAYGHFFQIPRFYDIYRNDALKDILVNDALVGNPALKPEKTVSLEIGLQQEISSDWGLNLTAYSKDISNLISSYYYFVGRDYTIFTNADFGRVQGIDVTLNKRLSNFYSFRITYSLMYAQGNESDPSEGFNSYTAESAHLRPNRNFYLDFDQRHKINTFLNVRLPEKFGPQFLGFYPFELFSLTSVFTVGSGLPYTPTSRAAEETNIVPEVNSARRPWTYDLDLRLSRRIPTDIFDATVYLDVENVFDAMNTRLIWTRTGEALDQGPTSILPKDRQANPANLDPRRSIRAGFYLEF